MRIIAGRHRGRRLNAPSNDAIRPTTDRIRESLFSILGPIHDLVVVDGYAGTGALGCEALSRGAEKVWFFDAHRASIELVRSNVELIGELEHAEIINQRFDRGVTRVDQPVDLVFLDPPYGSDEPGLALDALKDHPNVHGGTVIVLEQDRADEVPVRPDFEATDERLYGTTRLTFLRRAS